jgi:beta-carotene isomerase
MYRMFLLIIYRHRLYQIRDSLLDQILLKIFRKLVTENTGGVVSAKPGIEGLLEQGRFFMLKPGQTPEAQHKMVKETLGGLMTPYLPPFYRIFMSGIIPELGIEGLDGKQLGPWFYAPWLTALVTPPFFAFLVGPSRPNRRKDGSPGGLLVEKCKFLQESGCKGLCLHQCKIPAQVRFY